ncbi:MAG: helix-turn-helix domain-containing protein [Spongiibacter sp.]|nr:helix-turn-helix domain-containing protein [Spongiibacter sp.]
MGRKRVNALSDQQLYDKILKVAEKCFKRYGVQRTRMEDIAREVGVSRPLIYKIFGSRQAIIEILTAREVDSILGVQAAAVSAASDFAECVVEGTVVGVELSRKAGLLSGLVGESTSVMPEWVLDKDRSFYGMAMQVWAPVFELGRQSGMVRADLCDDELFEWLMSIHYMLLMRKGLEASEVRRLTRIFVSLR